MRFDAQCHVIGLSQNAGGNSAASGRFAFVGRLGQNPGVATEEYELVQLRNGACAVYAASYAEKMHPGLGPAAEAEALYVRQVKIRERMLEHTGEFVVWDVGLGAAANALTLLQLTRDLTCPLRIVSFDATSGPLEFALKYAVQLGYFHDYHETVRQLLAVGSVAFNDGCRQVHWKFQLGDFPAWLASTCAAVFQLPSPHAIFFDAFSPARNPAMWTQPLFVNLFRRLEPSRPCNLTTYSRSTMLRATLLLAGFFVGRGMPTGLKEETTVAATTRKMLEDPLDGGWLKRARRSRSAEPLSEPAYRQRPLSDESWAKLLAHAQFKPNA